MVIESFSPLQTSVTTYYLNSTTYKGSELMFNDSVATLYCTILRKDYTYPTRYYILENLKLHGFNNGTNYNYRVDLQNWIKIVHNDQFTLTSLSTSIKTFNLNNYDCELRVFISTTNPLLDNASRINSTLGNGQLYVSATDISSFTANKLIDYWIFSDSTKTNLKLADFLYTNSKYLITLGMVSNYTIDYIRSYDKNNSPVYNSTLETDISSSTSYYKIIMIDVDPKVYKMVIGYRVSGTLYEVTKYTTTCATNQYFYYSTNAQIDSIVCTGKREDVKNITKEEIKLSNKTKIVKIESEIKYTQQTGLRVPQSKIMDLSTTPFLFEFNSDWTYTKWILGNETFEGYTNKKISERNLTLDLTRENGIRRYTNFENNFYA